jgi:hypothetical protein
MEQEERDCEMFVRNNSKIALDPDSKTRDNKRKVFGHQSLFLCFLDIRCCSLHKTVRASGMWKLCPVCYGTAMVCHPLNTDARKLYTARFFRFLRGSKDI